MSFEDFNAYQKQAKETADYPIVGTRFIYPTLGLVGEAGEVAEKIKKIMRDRYGYISAEDHDALVKELGDVLWYLSQLATELDIQLADVAALNLAKLSSRKTRGVIHGDGDDR
jgi:NTP pyrophosphatase (non-canonical NTP hydrolase)